MPKQQSFIFIGRYGAGKGTQAKLLMKVLEESGQRQVLDMETGAGFRKFFQGTGHTQALSKKIIERGDLMPVFMCVYIWGNTLVEKFTGEEYLVFDGTPRKLMEAQIMEAVFPFFGLEKPWVIYLDVEHEESMKRLSLRAKQSGRADDSEEAIVRRRKAYEDDVIPTIEWYKTNPNVKFLDVDGERPIEAIHEEIVKLVGLK